MGAALRLFHLQRQILLQDEMHTVRAALRLSVGEILVRFRSEDPCLPLSALYRWLLDLGVPFSEMTFRLPVLAASLGAVVVLPWLASPLVGRRAAVLFAWLLALSPILALYAGTVRPYGLVSLLAPAAVLSVLRWREAGRPGWGLSFAVVGVLGLYFHLETGPQLAAPFGLLLLEKTVGRESRVSWRDLVLVAVASVALIVAMVAPAWESLEEFLTEKSGLSRFAWSELPPVLHLQAGSASTTVAILFWSIASLGFVTLWRSRRGVAIYLGASTVAAWLGLVIDEPFGLDDPTILTRYLIGTLPWMLLMAAVGLGAMVERIAKAAPLRSRRGAEWAQPWRAALGHAVPAAFFLVLALAGPFADREFLRSSFQHGQDFMRFDAPLGRIDPESVPSFYRGEVLRHGGGSIVEFPFRGGWSATRAHYVYQETHRAPVIAAEPARWLCDRRLRLRNHICPTSESILASGARFLVVHRDPLAEERLIVGGDDSGNGYEPREWRRIRRIAKHMRRRLNRLWGAPFDQDDRIAVWDLAAVRSGRRQRNSAG